MTQKDEFFIGWQDKMPPSNHRFLKKALLILFAGIPILAGLFVFSQQAFNDYQFEFGKESLITGTYYHHPFPMLVVEEGQLPKSLSGEILLVGYGKFGARGIMDSIQRKTGDLQGKKITLSGTLIHGDGKTLLELTRKTAAFRQIENPATAIQPPSFPGNAITVTGEIIDPKCYFGVMKPALGKIHKSCAIRCISGGIPPAFRQATGDPEKPYNYFLLLKENGQPINKEILPYVAEQVRIKGIAQMFMGWNILYVERDGILVLE